MQDVCNPVDVAEVECIVGKVGLRMQPIAMAPLLRQHLHREPQIDICIDEFTCIVLHLTDVSQGIRLNIRLVA